MMKIFLLISYFAVLYAADPPTLQAFFRSLVTSSDLQPAVAFGLPFFIRLGLNRLDDSERSLFLTVEEETRLTIEAVMDKPGIPEDEFSECIGKLKKMVDSVLPSISSELRELFSQIPDILSQYIRPMAVILSVKRSNQLLWDYAPLAEYSMDYVALNFLALIAGHITSLCSSYRTTLLESPFGLSKAANEELKQVQAALGSVWDIHIRTMKIFLPPDVLASILSCASFIKAKGNVEAAQKRLIECTRHLLHDSPVDAFHNVIEELKKVTLSSTRKQSIEGLQKRNMGAVIGVLATLNQSSSPYFGFPHLLEYALVAGLGLSSESLLSLNKGLRYNQNRTLTMVRDGLLSKSTGIIKDIAFIMTLRNGLLDIFPEELRNDDNCSVFIRAVMTWLDGWTECAIVGLPKHPYRYPVPATFTLCQHIEQTAKSSLEFIETVMLPAVNSTKDPFERSLLITHLSSKCLADFAQFRAICRLDGLRVMGPKEMNRLAVPGRELLQKYVKVLFDILEKLKEKQESLI